MSEHHNFTADDWGAVTELNESMQKLINESCDLIDITAQQDMYPVTTHQEIVGVMTTNIRALIEFHMTELEEMKAEWERNQ